MILRGAKELVQHNWSVDMGVSKSSGTPKSSILVGFSHYKPSILGYPYFWKHPYPCCFVRFKTAGFGFSRIRKANLFAKNVPKEQLLLGKEARLVATVVGLIFLTNHQGFVDSPFLRGHLGFGGPFQGLKSSKSSYVHTLEGLLMAPEKAKAVMKCCCSGHP